MRTPISELSRLTVPANTLAPQVLATRMLGQTSSGVDPPTGDGMTVAIVIALRPLRASE
jgi:hypothetical protein